MGTTDKPQHGKKWMPAMYVAYFGIIEQLANKHGYALCVHGSVVRDFDLIAIPFEPEVSPHIDLLWDIRNAVGMVSISGHPYDQMGYDSHLRTCYTIECGGGGYFDISFTPTLAQFEDLQRKDKQRREEMKRIFDSFPNVDTAPV